MKTQKLSVYAEKELNRLVEAKKQGLIKDFIDFKENPPMSGNVSYKYISKSPIAVIQHAGVGFIPNF